MTSSHGSSRLGIQLAQVGRFTFALIVGALFGVVAWESPASESHEATVLPMPAPDAMSAIVSRSNRMLASPIAPANSPNSAILPIGEAAAGKSHKKQQAAAAMPLRWSIDNEAAPPRWATAQDEEVAVRTADLHSRGPPARMANRSGRAQRSDDSPDPSGE